MLCCFPTVPLIESIVKADFNCKSKHWSFLYPQRNLVLLNNSHCWFSQTFSLNLPSPGSSPWLISKHSIWNGCTAVPPPALPSQTLKCIFGSSPNVFHHILQWWITEVHPPICFYPCGSNPEHSNSWAWRQQSEHGTSPCYREPIPGFSSVAPSFVWF